ncbi:uncharacterized protein TM35_000202010 [Trypanosoma theileri]|uniref:Uncharacterized protein n=1 Tax=Trypanosoma theileri TaxID=67003 RepID=A0A1X0NSW8_9TRYP|nr:uncharacterized protein TM35_000202010 [Trypanosoma theileri]ORC87792.1 hypothetical protein TM35_000202010 [Trypanosoma theileri]
MLTSPHFTEEHHEGRDGEEQQPRERETPLTAITPQNHHYPHEEDQQQEQEEHQEEQEEHQEKEEEHQEPQQGDGEREGEEAEEENEWTRNGGRQRLDSRPALPRGGSTTQDVSAPLRLRVTKNSIGSSSARGEIHAASNALQENRPGRKSLSSRRSSPHVATMTHPQSERKVGVYAKLVRDAARKLAARSPSRHTGSASCKSPSGSLELGRSGQRSVGTATAASTVTIFATAVAAAPASTSRATSVSPERSHVGMGLTAGYNHEEGGEVMSTHIPITYRQEGLCPPSARRVVQQTEPIQRTREQNTSSTSVSAGNVGGVSKRHSLCRSKRLLAPDDILWRRERRHRRSLSGELGYSTVKMLQLIVTEVPELPAVLEVALADHFLAALMRCGTAEVERVVNVLAPSDAQELSRQLRQMYGESRRLGHTSSTVQRRASRGKEDPRSEWLATHRRHLTSTMRGIAQCNVGKTDGVNGANRTNPSAKRLRNFIRIFTKEVCGVFMDECCALCATRRDIIRAEQPREVRARGTAVPDEVLDPFYTQVLSRLLFSILGWTDKESARVMSALLQQVKRQLPPYGRINLSTQA